MYMDCLTSEELVKKAKVFLESDDLNVEVLYV